MRSLARPLGAFLCGLSLVSACRHSSPAEAPADTTAAPRSAASRIVNGSSSDASTNTAAHPRPLATVPLADVLPNAPWLRSQRDADLLRFVDSIARRVSEVRDLSIVRPIARGVMNREQIMERLRAKVRSEYPPGEVDLEGEVAHRLGFIPEDMDYERTVFDLLAEQVAGFYDPDERQLYIASWVQGPMQETTMAHEITHALQDQHFDISRHMRHARGGGDRQTAAMAIVEGDATLVMLEYLLAREQRSVRDIPDPNVLFGQQFADSATQPRLAAAPPALQAELLFPYRYGFSLCARLYRDAGTFAPIDDLLRTPPDSTEQVLHPDKLARREPPIDVPARDFAPLATDYVLAYHDVMGEFGARNYLRAALSERDAETAAAGWGGDRVLLFVPRATGIDVRGGDAGTVLPAGALGQSFLAWVLVFDPAASARPDAEAAEFERGALQVLAQRYPHARAHALPGLSRVLETSQGRASAIARSGRVVVVLDRAPMDRIAPLARAALALGASSALTPAAGTGAGSRR